MIAFIRGINVGSHNRIAMPALRDALVDAGYADVRTYLQSGNVVLETRKSPARVARELERLLDAQFNLAVAVITRTREELAAVVDLNPLGKAPKDPKRYHVNFLDREPSKEIMRKLEDAAAGKEQVVLAGRELYVWYPNRSGRSKLAVLLSGKGLGVTATSRNWATVTNVLALADATSV